MHQNASFKRIIGHMDERLKKVLLPLKYQAGAELAPNIWNFILERNKKFARIKFFVFSIFGLASLAGLVPATKMLLNGFTQSGFSDYFSLLFSDGKSVISYWQEFAFSLAGSLPILSI